jgi:hypothetical protein
MDTYVILRRRPVHIAAHGRLPPQLGCSGAGARFTGTKLN